MVESYNDIRVVKKNLRTKYRSIREKLDPIEKEKYDQEIFERFVNSEFYKNAKSILCFVSTSIEVDTIRIIKKAFEDKKQVAVPKCLDKKGTMDFFVIRSLDELFPSFFGLLEPDEKKSPVLRNYKKAVCVLPGFAFDRAGYRIGFGKGYYDRFLHDFTGLKVGVCYNQCIASQLPHGRYDETADYVITPKYTMSI